MTYTVVKSRAETRTRQVPNPSGAGTVPQEYTVDVPFTEERMYKYDVKKPLPSKRVDVPLTQFSLLRANGEVVITADAVKILASPRHVFLLRTPNPNFSIDAYHRSFLNDDFLVLWIDPEFAIDVENEIANPVNGSKAAP